MLSFLFLSRDSAAPLVGFAQWSQRSPACLELLELEGKEESPPSRNGQLEFDVVYPSDT